MELLIILKQKASLQLWSMQRRIIVKLKMLNITAFFIFEKLKDRRALCSWMFDDKC